MDRSSLSASVIRRVDFSLYGKHVLQKYKQKHGITLYSSMFSTCDFLRPVTGERTRIFDGLVPFVLVFAEVLSL